MPIYEIAMLIDARGLSGSGAIDRTAQALRWIQSGEVVEVVATDERATRDFAAWAQSTGHVLLDASSNGGIDRFVIRHK